MRGLDFFQKVNQDIDTSTATGGVYSIIAFVVGFILFWNELKDYRTDQMIYKMRVQQLEVESVKANIDLHIYGSPCTLLALDLQDEVGNHTLDYTDTIKKIRVLKDGTELESGFGDGNPNYRGSSQEIDEAIDAVNNEEGCRINGYINLKKVPGNFHISYHAKMDVMNRIASTKPDTYSKINLNYKINHLGFGENTNHMATIFKIMGRTLFQETNTNDYPHDDTKYINPGKNDYDNYLKILPCRYDSNKLHMSVSRYKYAMYSTHTPKSSTEIPTIFFRYEISPINVYYSTKSKSFYHFLVQIFAIVGGIFAVMGIFNSLTTGVISKISKNH
ncbi:endoplasmic reticulum vesicle transporter (macronuclear) [Tetrahymena thermophila SB210]|uniref:Endoplasmic reticulum vesicle transporter n=1 Tax=Tetrahymena thermophila (strain SB210) TaxID=312017 RepID=Q234K8_TETTS|nr:endoplasmic reticulum vesicle transporter [Tetrahymena thermophila SB210]EAR91995.2 endoplasmic reticulum vesicle transporter [Tetrahymena thermophila SB210]|eukprot:XP_001012240.2 endoplasmic reticulum vesicle transporter [Tetrahymena thermophila SB210]